MFSLSLTFCCLSLIGVVLSSPEDPKEPSKYKRDPAPDGHRCGICPTYYHKICAFDRRSNGTIIFDNHCIMDLYNCMHDTRFVPFHFDNCLYFGNFAYVHGFKQEDLDYGEDLFTLKHTLKNP